MTRAFGEPEPEMIAALVPWRMVDATVGGPKITTLPADVASDSRPAPSVNKTLKAVVPLRRRVETTEYVPLEVRDELIPQRTSLQSKTAKRPDVPLPPVTVARLDAIEVEPTEGCWKVKRCG